MNVGMCLGVDLSNVVTMTRRARPFMIGTAAADRLAVPRRMLGRRRRDRRLRISRTGAAPRSRTPSLPDGSSGSKSDAGSGAKADRSVVVTGTMTVTAQKPLAAADKAVSIVEAAGGRVDGRTENAATDGDQGSATLVLRIPADKLTPTLDALKKLGRPDQVSTDATDVTTESQDLGARIDALRASITRLLQLESTATDTTNLIAIETAISDRQGELESLEAQQRGLDDQISMSTITLDLRSDAAAPPVKPADFWTGLGAGWAAFVAFWAGTLVVLGVLLPWLVFLGIAAIVTVVIVRLRAAACAPVRPLRQRLRLRRPDRPDEGEQREAVGLGRVVARERGIRLADGRPSPCRRTRPFVDRAIEQAEGSAQQFAQLVFARQPERIVERDRVERPLGRAVEAEHRSGRIAVRLDRHVADREDVALEVGEGDLEAVAGRRGPDQSGVAQFAGEGGGDHASIFPLPVSPPLA